jgi:hypothetical protein
MPARCSADRREVPGEPTIKLPSVALRSANFRLQGNGRGAASTRAYGVVSGHGEGPDAGTVARQDREWLDRYPVLGRGIARWMQ